MFGSPMGDGRRFKAAETGAPFLWVQVDRFWSGLVGARPTMAASGDVPLIRRRRDAVTQERGGYRGELRDVVIGRGFRRTRICGIGRLSNMLMRQRQSPSGLGCEALRQSRHRTFSASTDETRRRVFLTDTVPRDGSGSAINDPGFHRYRNSCAERSSRRRIAAQPHEPSGHAEAAQAKTCFGPAREHRRSSICSLAPIKRFPGPKRRAESR
jgi:hypothetical protein